MIYDELDGDLKFLVLEGDYVHLNGVYINSYNEKLSAKERKQADKLQEELSKLLYGGGGAILLPYTNDFPTEVVQKGGSDLKVIVAGFLP